MLRFPRLVVVLENRCYIHHLDTLEILRVLETPPNQRGVVAVSPSSENCLLALPTSSSAVLQPQPTHHRHSAMDMLTVSV